MNSSNVTIGIIVILIGIFAIAFNKYPGKTASFENAKKKYGSANERKIAIFDGVFCIIYGIAYMTLGLLLLTILLVAYYPTRILFLKLKLI